MSRAEKVILTNMCMIEDEKGCVLMQIRDPKRYVWHGYALPGGHVEEKESLHEALVREVYEETGLRVKDPQLMAVKHFHTRDEGIRYLVFLYKVTAFEGSVRSSEEGEIKWVAKSDLRTVELAPYMEDIIDVFEKGDVSELFYFRDEQDDLQSRYF